MKRLEGIPGTPPDLLDLLRAGVDPDDFDEALALFNQVERVQSARE